MRHRQINLLRHDFSARQALSMALDYWRVSRSLPIALITPAGQAANFAKLIRVALSKERKRVRAKGANYGFVTSAAFSYTDGDIKGECIILRWRVTMLQRIRNGPDLLIPLDHKGLDA